MDFKIKIQANFLAVSKCNVKIFLERIKIGGLLHRFLSLELYLYFVDIIQIKEIMITPFWIESLKYKL